MGFTADQECVLTYLVGHQCVSPKTAKRLEAIVRDLGDTVANLDDVLQSLLNCGAIGQTKKGEAGKIHCYVSTNVLHYLKERGLWSPSRIHHL
jgi:hypothetical protein